MIHNAVIGIPGVGAEPIPLEYGSTTVMYSDKSGGVGVDAVVGCCAVIACMAGKTELLV